MSAAEQFILTVSENGYGKRTSSFEYRITGRGGKGIVAMAVNDRNGRLVASFPVEDARPDHLRHRRRPDHPHAGRRRQPIRIAGRGTQGVTLFDTQGEKVVSVEHLADDAANGEARRRRRGALSHRPFALRQILAAARFEAGRSAFERKGLTLPSRHRSHSPRPCTAACADADARSCHPSADGRDCRRHGGSSGRRRSP